MQENRENNTNIIDRLCQFIEYKNITFNKLAVDLGLSNSYFSKMVKNRGSMGAEIIEKILRNHPELNPTWFMLGDGEMIQKKYTPEYTPEYTPDEKNAPENAHLNADELLLKLYEEKKAVPYSWYVEKEKDIERLNKEIGRLEAQLTMSREAQESATQKGGNKAKRKAQTS